MPNAAPSPLQLQSFLHIARLMMQRIGQLLNLSLQRGTTAAMHITVARLLLLHCLLLLSLRVLLVGLLLLQR